MSATLLFHNEPPALTSQLGTARELRFLTHTHIPYFSQVAHAQLQREQRRQQSHGAVGAMDQAPGQLEFITTNSYVLHLLFGIWIFEILKICVQVTTANPLSQRQNLLAGPLKLVKSWNCRPIHRLRCKDSKKEMGRMTIPPSLFFSQL